MERLTTNPTAPVARRRDVVAFLWNCDADARRRQARVRRAAEVGDIAEVAACWREADLQAGLALYLAREAAPGELRCVEPTPPPRTLMERLAAAWAILRGR